MLDQPKKCSISPILKQPSAADVYLIHLSQNGRFIQRAESLLMKNSTEFKTTALQLPLPSLQQMKSFSNQIKQQKIQPVIAEMSYFAGFNESARVVKMCKFLYKTRSSINPGHVGCRVYHIFTENAAAFLNMTVENVQVFHPSVRRTKNPTQEQIQAKARQYIAGNTETFYSAVILEILPLTHSEHEISQMIRGTSISRFLYCVAKDEREAFSFTFWIIPFDSMTWTMLGIAVGVFTLFVKGNWFEIYSILIQESCSILNNHKYLIIFVYGSILITFCYEEFISSFIIILPPIIIH